MNNERFVYVPELTERYGISYKTLAAWEAQGKIPRAIRLGRKLRWLESEIRAWEAQQIAASKGKAE